LQPEITYCEYSAHLHEHFVGELRLNGQNYLLPEGPGYSTEFKTESIQQFQYPNGTYWKTALAN
jgi:L-alanine-DL-glutamate epimerase-like enolase superfamily enzyme